MGDVVSKFRYFGSIVFGLALVDDFHRLSSATKFPF